MAHRWRVLIVVSAAVFMASLDLFIVNIAFPAIERDFGNTSLASLSWILNAYAIVFAAVGGVAAAAGPPVGGLLVQAGWQLVFLVNVPIGITLLVFAVRILSEAREPAGTPRPDLAGAALLTAAIATLTLGIVKSSDWGWGATQTVALLVAAAVLLGAFWLRSNRHPAPIVEPDLLRRRSFALANAGALLFFM